MGVQRSEYDPDSIVDNVTRPNDGANHVYGGVDAASAAVDQDEAVDITIDEDDHQKVFGSQSSVPHELLQRAEPPLRSGALATIARTEDLPPSPPPSYDSASQPLTDAASTELNEVDSPRTYHLLLPTALYESGLLFNPQLSQSRVTVERDPTPEAPSSPPSVAADSIISSSTASSTSTAPVPTLAEIEACKPHPDALFVAETLEWRLVLDQSSIYRASPSSAPHFDATNLYEACNLSPGSVVMYETKPVTIPAKDQRSTVHLLQHWDAANPDAPLPALEEFNAHRCYFTGKHLLSSPPDRVVSIVDRQLLAGFKESRENDPAVGLTGPESFLRALSVVLRVIGNYVHGERRGVPTTSPSLTQKLGWDHFSRQIFLDLGWKQSTMPDSRNAILPPTSELESFDDNIHLRRNTRAWLELTIWHAFHIDQLRKTRPSSPIISAPDKFAVATRVLIRPASESLVELIGWRQDHLDTSYRTELSTSTLEAFYILGASSNTSDQLVKFAYLVNMQANQNRRAVELFAALDEVYTSQRRTSRILEELVTYERSQGRYTPRDVDKAYERLHLSAAHLGSDVERLSIPHDLIVDNYKARAREVLINSDTSEHAAVKAALRVITLHLDQPERLVQALDEDVDMDIDQACSMLDANADMDDSTVLAIFDLYVTDAPARRDALRHALRAIAEHRNSDYLRHFLRTGEKDASVSESWQQLPSDNLPAGIDNIGNTCYLNSVLQYFFSITEVRNRVLQAAATLSASNDEVQLDLDIERRVGGQRITARDWQRSRRFVAQLGGLFHHLIHANALSVRPERELAYLALVSSRAEYLEAELNPAPEPSSLPPHTDGLVSPDGSAVPPNEPAPSDDRSDGVVGSDSTPSMATSDTMDIAPDELPPTQIDPKQGPPSETLTSAPPLPPRPTRRSTMLDSTSTALPPPARRNSLMQLGAQQDVSECLDNCMFQLEIALAASEAVRGNPEPSSEQTMDVDGSDEMKPMTGTADHTQHDDLLTRLFLGKTCQRIEADTIPSASASNSSDQSISRPAQPQKQPSTHIKHEVFKILPIDVLEEGRDIYDGFDGFFDSDTFVATSGAVQRRSVTLLSAPPLLQIQLQRVQYDRVTMRAFKSQAHLDMPETLYVDRYMDLDEDESGNAARIAKRLDYQAKRKRIEDLRAKLAACKDGPNFHLTQTLSQAANAVEELARLPSLADMATQLKDIEREGAQPEAAEPAPLSPRSLAKQAASQVDQPVVAVDSDVASQIAAEDSTSAYPAALSTLIDPGFATLLRDESKLLREQVKQAQNEINTLKTEMASIWADERRYSYRLVAAFMHRGEASHGHYFLNLRGGGADSKWFKYNDSAVSETSLDQVLRDRSGATPYLVTYVREDYVRLIDPICRSIEGQQGSVEVQQGKVQQEAVEGPDAGDGGVGEAMEAEAVQIAASAGAKEHQANVLESPIKRARTDDL
ncbi:ubiquitin C-terminal hydrolase [Pseudozyma hubeiensis SY62]|uniref:ubiquitinyl hydrolase 1 n=1 Tax=Pseudozyma hubeiensis (strain SY62) TaxID=1305764 RepID=R9PHB4_PSEHS|nr:ubiquitin C-terminal hydrolase [Pseudozyma hubeiensis SY62]GAC97485.1 ubiquitin C-terminal hydrolase [Pseudozyma hubeiensis SY62]